MKKWVVLTKEVGETPLMAIRAWKATQWKYADASVCFAGRLDPMAEGKLLMLIGEECKRKEHYTKLDKEYEIEVLLDVLSDTGDVLGLVTYAGKETQIDAKVVRSVLRAELGTHLRAYPTFSSKTVDGKPLFLHALEGVVSYMILPEHEEHIYSIQLKDIEHISASALASRIEEKLVRAPKTDEPSKRLGADFRIADVRASWNKLFSHSYELEKKDGGQNCTVLKLKVVCGTGTYMRTLAPRIGEALGTKALALSIKRTKIGKYWNGIWLRQY